MFSVCRNNPERMNVRKSVVKNKTDNSYAGFCWVMRQQITCTPTEEPRETTAPHRSHQPSNSLSPRAQGCNGSWEPRLRTLKEQTTSLGPFQACPSRATAPMSGCETHHDKSSGAALQTTFWSKGICYLGMWDTPWDAREGDFGIAQDFCRMFRDGIEDGEKGVV